MLHHPIIKPNHMQVPWHDPIRDQKELPVSQAPLPIRAGVDGLAQKQSQDSAVARQQSRKPNSYGTGQRAA